MKRSLSYLCLDWERFRRRRVRDCEGERERDLDRDLLERLDLLDGCFLISTVYNSKHRSVVTDSFSQEMRNFKVNITPYVKITHITDLLLNYCTPNYHLCQ